MLQGKVEKALSIQLESQELVEATRGLGDFYHSNSLDERRALRHTLASRSVDATLGLLASLHPIIQLLDRLQQENDVVCRSIDQESAVLSKAMQETSHLLKQVEDLQSKKSDSFIFEA